MWGSRRGQSAAVGVILFVGIIGSACGTSETAERTAATETPTASLTPAPPPPATPTYSVIGQSGNRYDGQPVYFVVIDPVDLSTDGFKQNIKLVIQAVANTHGSPDFSARVFDDEDIASEAFSEETHPPLGSPDEIRAFEDLKAQHLVAMYAGGFETMPEPYVLRWYPGAFTGTPNVGQYVDSEEWQPA